MPSICDKVIGRASTVSYRDPQPRESRRMALRRTALRPFCSQSARRNQFSLPLPKDFNFSSTSVIYSNGRQLTPESPATSIEVHNPATEELLQTIHCASPQTVQSAITDANNVFKSGEWSRAEPTQRYQVLNNVAHLLRQQNKELAARTFQWE